MTTHNPSVDRLRKRLKKNLHLRRLVSRFVEEKSYPSLVAPRRAKARKIRKWRSLWSKRRVNFLKSQILNFFQLISKGKK